MNNNDKPTIRHFDDFPFTGDVSGAAGNTIVCGRTGAGKTALLQAVIGRYTDGNGEQGQMSNEEPVE